MIAVVLLPVQPLVLRPQRLIRRASNKSNVDARKTSTRLFWASQPASNFPQTEKDFECED
jgi:hypothetical protein